MILVHYIKYFFYIALNWNFRLAFFSIYHEMRGERKYGLNTSHLNNLEKLTLKGDVRQHAEIYQGANYYLVEEMFKQLSLEKAGDGLLDMGCGKGRILIVAAYNGFTNITGVDFAKELCIEAEKNCMRFSNKFPAVKWHVIHGDASTFRININIHTLFFFNPFAETVMRPVIKNILQSQKKRPRKIHVVYINPQHKELFIGAGFKEIFQIKKMQYIEACLLEKNG